MGGQLAEEGLSGRANIGVGRTEETSKAQGMLLLDDSLLKLHNSGRIDKHPALEHAFDKKMLETRIGGGA